MEKKIDGKLLCTNKKAQFNYFLSDHQEAGIELLGSEIKSLRKNRCSLDDAFVIFKGNEAFILNINIPVFQDRNVFSHEPRRTRKLLLHKNEIYYLMEQVKMKGYTVVPCRVILRRGLCKIQIALGKGKKNYDKREVIKAREDKIKVAKASKIR